MTTETKEPKRDRRTKAQLAARLEELAVECAELVGNLHQSAGRLAESAATAKVHVQCADRVEQLRMHASSDSDYDAYHHGLHAGLCLAHDTYHQRHHTPPPIPEVWRAVVMRSGVRAALRSDEAREQQS